MVSNEISRRFDQKDFTIVAEIEMILAAGNGQEFTMPETIQTLYKGDFQTIRLSTHLNMLPDIIKRHGELTGNQIKKVTNVRTVCQAMNGNPGAKALCPELQQFLLTLQNVWLKAVQLIELCGSLNDIHRGCSP